MSALDHNIAIVFQAIHGLAGNSCSINIALFQSGGGHFQADLDEFDLLDPGCALVVVLIGLIQVCALGLVVIDQLEGSGAGQSFRIIKAGRIANILVNMLGQDGQSACHLVQEGRIIPGKSDLYSVVIAGVNTFYHTRIHPLIGMVFYVLISESDVLCREWLAVVPGHPLAKIEDIGFLIGKVVPALRQGGHKSVLVLPDECVKDQAHPNIAGAAGIMSVRRGMAPIAGAVGYGYDIHALIGSQ